MIWVFENAYEFARAFHVVLMVKILLASAGNIRDQGSIPGSGKSPGGGHSNPLQHSCLENPMDRGACRATGHRVTKSQTQLKRLNMQEHPRLAYRMGRGTRTFRSILWFSFCCAEVYKREEVTWSDWDSKSSGRGVDGLQVDSQSQETSEGAVTLVVRGAEGWPEAVKEGMDLKWCLQDQ